MGAITSNRKRRDGYFKSFAPLSTPIDLSYVHVAKKAKLSSSMNQSAPRNCRPASSNSVAARISQYPETKPGISREVHAPVRNSRFSFNFLGKRTEATASSRERPADKMGIFGSFQRLLNYDKAKDSAMRTLRFVRGKLKEKEKEKEVIEVDSEDENRDNVSDDSSIEVVEFVDLVGNKWKKVQELNARPAETEVRSLDSSGITDVSNAMANVDNGEKKGLDDSGVPSYIRFLESVRKRDGKLADLDFDIEMTEKRIKGLQIIRPPKKEEPIKKDVVKECFVPLTREEESEVRSALSMSNRRRVLVTHENSNIDITGENLQCLKPGGWLNDEVINLYLELLKERERREPEKFLKCHFFNTFFYKKLISGRGDYNFSSVRRWTTKKKLGYSLLECDKIFVPIHQQIHWCLAIINKKDKKFQYLDSLGGVDHQVMDVLARYFVDEVKDKCGKDIDVSSWEEEFVEDLPVQENGFDCGMFMIKYADFYSRDIGLCFSQEHMSYFRRRTAKEILKLRAN